MTDERENLPIEPEGTAHSLSEDPPASLAPADPDLVVVRDAADEFSLGLSSGSVGAVVESDLVIDRTGFTHPDVTPMVVPVTARRPPRPPLRRESILPPELQPPPVAAAPAPAPVPESKSTFDWDAELSGKATRKTSPRLAEPPPLPEPQVVKARVTRTLTPAQANSRLVAVIATGVFLSAFALMAFRVEPFHSWFYLFAWYPFLAVVNFLAARQKSKYSLFEGRIGRTIELLAWSVPVWMCFELWNLRLQNWYYIGVPDNLALRWSGIALSFATVLPGIFFVEEVLAARGAFSFLRSGTRQFSARILRAMQVTGLSIGVLTLILPEIFFAFVWGVPVLLLEPWLHRRGHHSLLVDLESGRPGRLLRLLIAGLICGLFWESMNFLAGGKWIYTVPFVGSFKVFEMPLFGFLGFAPFALSCWTLSRVLVELGLLGEWRASSKTLPAKGRTSTQEEDNVTAEEGENETRARGSNRRDWKLVGAVAAVLGSVLTLVAMERWTIDSRTARPENVPGIPQGVADYAHSKGYHDVHGLLEMIEQGLLYIPGESSAAVLEELEETCRIVELKGLGTANARRLARAGVKTRQALALQDPYVLSAKLVSGEEPFWQPQPSRVQVWIDAARNDLAR